jgi:hypothetical protein
MFQSQAYPSVVSRCMKFWYHMYGDGVGSLNIYRKLSSSPLTDILWKKSGNQDNIWRLGRVNLDRTSFPDNVTIYFEGVKGKNVRSDIALDDITIQEGSCGSPYFCDFEEDICGWTNAVNGFDDEFDWLRNQGPTPTYGTGPSVDVTLGTAQGWYIYIGLFIV